MPEDITNENQMSAAKEKFERFGRPKIHLDKVIIFNITPLINYIASMINRTLSDSTSLFYPTPSVRYPNLQKVSTLPLSGSKKNESKAVKHSILATGMGGTLVDTSWSGENQNREGEQDRARSHFPPLTQPKKCRHKTLKFV